MRVVDQEGNAVDYREKADFVYEASQPCAQAGKEYHVEITTAAGKTIVRVQCVYLKLLPEGVTASAAIMTLMKQEYA